MEWLRRVICVFRLQRKSLGAIERDAPHAAPRNFASNRKATSFSLIDFWFICFRVFFFCCLRCCMTGHLAPASLIKSHHRHRHRLQPNSHARTHTHLVLDIYLLYYNIIHSLLLLHRWQGNCFVFNWLLSSVLSVVSDLNSSNYILIGRICSRRVSHHIAQQRRAHTHTRTNVHTHEWLLSAPNCLDYFSHRSPTDKQW